MKSNTISYLKAFGKNLLLLTIIIISTMIFTKIFYPNALNAFIEIGKVYTGLNLWPIIIVVLLLSALPKKSK